MSSSNKDECSICENDFNAEDNLVITECLHIFHRACAQKRVDERKKTNCHICRKDSALDEALRRESATTDKICTICEEAWYPKEDLVMTSCHHVFHRTCAHERLDKRKKTDCHVCHKNSALGDALKQEISHPMLQQTIPTKSNRFVNTDILELQQANHTPISGYQEVPVMSLEKAVESIVEFVPHVKDYAKKAKERCRQSTKLTINESAAIYLYTMDIPFYPALNKTFRAENRNALKPWFAFLKLFITGMNKLPSLAVRVWRGVANDIGSNFKEDNEQTWWAINSCSLNVGVVEYYIGNTGTVFAIDVIRGKDISAYSAIPDDAEVVLMPETSVRVKGPPLNHKNSLFIVHLEECGMIPPGQHVMLSYNSNSQTVVSKIHQILLDWNIPVWFDKQGDVDKIYDRLAKGVENAAVICCFITPDYEKSDICQLELQYAHKRRKPIIPCMIIDTNVWKPYDWLESIIKGLECIDFHDVPDSSLEDNVLDLIYRIKKESSTKQGQRSKSIEEPSYLFELVKYECKRNSRIERLMNPSVSYSIEKSYINLAIVDTKEHREKEKKLKEIQNIDAVIDTFEQIYGSKTSIDVKDIFETCKDQAKQVLVFGRAGIGKSTFCRYAAYKWAIDTIWPEYELVVLFPLRSLTANRYPPGPTYSPIDIVDKEYFSYPFLLEEDKKVLKQQLSRSRILWLLDGHDEIAQNVPPHLENLLEQLLKTPHHIVTSRPYMNTLSYSARMEITGFTDENIPSYIKQFFDQFGNESQNPSTKYDKLLSFLKMNPRIWGIAHIPINLELICSVWSNTNWSERKVMTITMLYDELIEWICRRYLEKQKGTSIRATNLMGRSNVYEACKNELAFLESLAFHGMESNAILLGPEIQAKAENESQCFLFKHPNLLNVGILKSSTQDGIGTQVAAYQHYYFVHLSFQEHFAARYVVNALNGSDSSRQKAIDFIKKQKYNQRFALVFTFVSGLLIEYRYQPSIDIFWNTINGDPTDLIGFRHMQLLVSCFDEGKNSESIPYQCELINFIINWMKLILSKPYATLAGHLQNIMKRSSLPNNPSIQNALIDLLHTLDVKPKRFTVEFISSLQITEPQPNFIESVADLLQASDYNLKEKACNIFIKLGPRAAFKKIMDKLIVIAERESWALSSSAYFALEKMGEEATTSILAIAVGKYDSSLKAYACKALGRMSKKAVTSEIINALVMALQDKDKEVRKAACEGLSSIGKKAATDTVINAFVNAIQSDEDRVRWSAEDALERICEQARTMEVLDRLVIELGNNSSDVRSSAYTALVRMGEKALTTEVINRLVMALQDDNKNVREAACRVLNRIGKIAATNEIIDALLSALQDNENEVRLSASDALGTIGTIAGNTELLKQLIILVENDRIEVRVSACETFSRIGKKAATKEVINTLVTAVQDLTESVRRNACEALGNMGKNAATKEVINTLVTAFQDSEESVRRSAREALGRIGKKEANDEIINRLLTALEDRDKNVRDSAFKALGNMGEKAATTVVINRLGIALQDENDYVRESACKALRNMSKKGATSTVVHWLTKALGDTNRMVRHSAYETLRGMDELVITNEMTERLAIALEDEDSYIRDSAMEVLRNIAGIVASSDAIKRVVIAVLRNKAVVRHGWREYDDFGHGWRKYDDFGHGWRKYDDFGHGWREYDDLRHGWWEVLKILHEKGTSTSVIDGLVMALKDDDEDVKFTACQALAIIGEKAATDEVIIQLMITIEDTRENIRKAACVALGRMDKSAVTSEVISGLMTVLHNESYIVRLSASEALGNMGERAATDTVINGLLKIVGIGNKNGKLNVCESFVKEDEKSLGNDTSDFPMTVLADKDGQLTSSIFETFGEMGEKAATTGVIDCLVTALEDKNWKVRQSACVSWGKMSNKVGTINVINRLVALLQGQNPGVRRSACEILRKIGESGAAKDVTNGLVTAIMYDKVVDVNEVGNVLTAMIRSFSAMTQLHPDTVRKLYTCIDRYGLHDLMTVPVEHFIKVFLHTKNCVWLPVVTIVSLMQGTGVCITENTIVVYSSCESVEVFTCSEQLRQQLIEAFVEQAERLQSTSEMLSKAGTKSKK